jgi:putative FmdB family regulatory protein
MPLYEYKCSACGHGFERIVKFSDPPVRTCPQCGKDAVEQLIHAPAVQFKGSGWYVSDYARKSNPGAPSSTSSEGGESVSGSKEGAAKEGASKADSSASTGKTPGSASDAAGGASSKPGSSGEKK